MTDPRTTSRPVDAGALWAGGAAAGVVAALIVVVGILLCRGILDIAVLAPKGEGAWGDADTATYAAGAFLAALIATGVMHVLMRATPRPGTFFAWIMVLVTAIAAFAPFAVKASTESRVATAMINIAVGLAVGTLVAASARSAARKASLAARPPLTPPSYRPMR